MIAKNGPEWWIIILGLVGAVVNGVIFPSFALFFGQVLQVFTLPPNEVLSAIHLWAGLFIVLGTVSGVAIFFKVRIYIEHLTGELQGPKKFTVAVLYENNLAQDYFLFI